MALNGGAFVRSFVLLVRSFLCTRVVVLLGDLQNKHRINNTGTVKCGALVEFKMVVVVRVCVCVM